MRIISLACACLTAIGASGCVRPTESCSTLLQPAIRLTIADSVSGLPAASGSTVVAVRNGFDSESVTTPAGPANEANTITAGTRPGTYALTVQKALYATWTKDVDVQSVGAQCRQPQTVTVQAKLKKLP